jgi:hypothetical protein
MKDTAYKIAVITALLFACLAPATSFAKDKHKHKHDHDKSGIIGQIVQMPGPWHIRIDTKKDKLIEDIVADEDGFFKVDLDPGTYLLTPFFPPAPGDTAELIGATQSVTVEKKEFTEVELLIVQGPDMPLVYEPN